MMTETQKLYKKLIKKYGTKKLEELLYVLKEKEKNNYCKACLEEDREKKEYEWEWRNARLRADKICKNMKIKYGCKKCALKDLEWCIATAPMSLNAASTNALAEEVEKKLNELEEIENGRKNQALL